MTAAACFDRLHPAVQHHVVNTLGWSPVRVCSVALARTWVERDNRVKRLV